MAQIRVLKIDASGFTAEHNSTNDDITFKTLTAGTSLEVSGGIKVTDTSIVFANDNDTIEHPNGSIEVQNLLDKTDTETVSGDWTFSTTPQNTDNVVNPNDIATKEYVDGVAKGLDWQDSVTDIIASNPGTSSVGDRYIVANAATGSFAGEDEKIAEFFSSWVFTTPNEGFAAWVEDEDKVYVYNSSYPTGDWVKMATVHDHNNLANLQGGNGSDEYYHITSAEDTWIANALTEVPSATNLVSDNADETITGDWNFNGVLDNSAGNYILPSASSAAPSEGETYWDAANDALMVYDGSDFLNVTQLDEDSVTVKYTYTAGENLAKGEAVYVSADDTVMKADADQWPNAKAIGLAKETVTSGNSVVIIRSGPIAGILTGATASKTYFLSTTAGGIQTSPPASGAVKRMGYAINATDFMVEMGEIRRRAS